MYMSVYKCTRVCVCVCVYLPQPHSLFLTFSERLYCSLHIPVEIKDLLCGRQERYYGSPVSICVCIWVLVGDNYPAILDKGKYFIHHFTRLAFFGLVWFCFIMIPLWSYAVVLCVFHKEWTNCMSVFFSFSQSYFLFRSFWSFQQTVYTCVCVFISFFSSKFTWLNISFFMMLLRYI